MTSTNLNPLIQWVGGKRRLVPELLRYTKQQFDFDDQIRVCDLFFDLQKRGVKVMLSNSDTPEIRELYAEANIHQVELQRLISAKAATRKKVNELVITNY